MTGGVDLVDELADEWRHLCETADHEPFYRPEWTSAYLRAFQPRGRLVVITVRIEGSLKAVLPLLKETRLYLGVPATILRRVGNAHCTRSDLVYVPGRTGDMAIEALWKRLREYPGWDLIDFANTPEDGAFQKLVALARRDGYHADSVFSYDSASLSLDDAGADTPPWLSHTSASFRSHLRRGLRRIRETGPLTAVQHRAAGSAALERFYELEGSGWKGRRGTAIACDEQTRDFYDAIARAADDFGYLSLDFLEVDGRPISGHFGLTHNGRYFLLKAAYDETFRKCGPGHLLVHEVLREHQERKLRSFDFTGPVTWDEQRWTADTRAHVRSCIFQKSPRGALMLRLRRTRRRAARLRRALRETWRWQGPPGLFRAVTDRLLRPLMAWEWTHVVELDFRTPLSAPRLPKGFELHLYEGQAHAPALQEELGRTSEISPEKVAARLACGDVVAVVRKRGQLAGFSWSSSHAASVRDMEPTLHLQPGEIYIHHSFVLRQFRGNALHACMLDAFARLARERGFTRALAYIDFWNRPSLKSLRRLGGQKVQSVVTVRFRWTKRKWCAAFRPRGSADRRTGLA